MRYVRNRLVIRLSSQPSDELIAEINEVFADIVTEGDIRLAGPLSEERDEPQLAVLPRLVLRFNRRSLGRLRQLIDCLNAGRILQPALDAANRIERAARDPFVEHK
jgi:hypothetical protein